MVDFGIYIPQIALTFDEILERALRTEAAGIGSFWLFDHLYGPGLPTRPALEGWTLATAILARTTTLRVGHLVLDNNLRHPALVAKMAATLDVISSGRLEFGIGSGSYADEHHQAGLPWAGRTARLAEALEIITRMWAEDSVTFAGEHYQLDALPSLPRPVQQPHPPIIIGGSGPRTLDLVARYADVWNLPTYALVDLLTPTQHLQRACDAAGRDPTAITRSIEAVLVLAPDDGAVAVARERAMQRYAGPGWGLEAGGFIGTATQIADRVNTLVDAGIGHFVFFPSDRGSTEMIESFAADVVPLVTG